MELTLAQALQKGVEAHKAGQVQEADRYYTAILKAQPKHPDANHNMGVLAVGVGKVEAALPFFKTALEANPKIAQYWLSYIDALIKLGRLDDAKAVFEQAKSTGAKGDGFDQLEQRLNTSSVDVKNEVEEDILTPPNILDELKLDQALKLANKKVKDGLREDARKIYQDILKKFPKNKKALDRIKTLASKPLANTSVIGDLPNDQLQVLVKLYTRGQYQEVLGKGSQLLEQFPRSGNLLNIIGVANKSLGKLSEAIQAFNKALSIIPDYPDAYNNMGITLQEQGKLEEAIKAYNKAVSIKPDFAEAYWNLSGTAEGIIEAKKWVEKCLEANSSHLKANSSHLKAKLTLIALQFYEGDKSKFNALMKSSLKDNAYMRSFNWAFNLPKLPTLHFHRWALFDQMIDLSKQDRPFYEFGVWKGEAFRYLIKTFKKGYGFDTFEGLPEDWHNEKVGTYCGDGNVPKIDGGKFIVGKFEDTLPGFFAEDRPMASIINFDADLYSSTICALHFAKPIIDKHTILIFDEFMINENWEQDEYKALEEFCSNNYYTYEVLAISFFTKQVAVRIVGI